MRKKVLAGVIIMLSISSIGLGANRHNPPRRGSHNNNRYDRDRHDNQRRYNQIYSRYSYRIDSLERKIRDINRDIEREKSRNNVDWRRVDRLTAERNFARRDLDSVYSDLRNDLRRNNLSAYGPKR